ncbi:rhodanese-like domain-containing protein [Flavobacteriales bacterium]|jgi:rhodanese-related sulfurtransferase|nr:rhodanese-like domain-containing protein [Flavobacteriales bacterium]MDG1395773.1 rhodanese-like domain-containing protein [Flavobacteriales bacterium]
MKNLSKESWKKALIENENSVLLDVRTPQECQAGMQENAIQLNFLDPVEFMAGIESLDKNNDYYVYCRSGARSSKACSLLNQKGFTTFNLLGGMLDWDGKVV